MARVFVTQIPHKRDPDTRAFVPSVNISTASEFGDIVVMMPPRASFFATADLVRQMSEHLKDYDCDAGDCIIAMGDPVVMATAFAILGRKGAFTVLRWDRNLGRYTTVKVKV